MLRTRAARARANRFKRYRGLVLKAIASALDQPWELMMKDLKTPGDGRAAAIHRAHTQGRPEGAPPAKPEDAQKACREGYDAEVARQKDTRRKAAEEAQRQAEQKDGN